MTKPVIHAPMDPLKFLFDAPLVKGIAALFAVLLAYLLPTEAERTLAASAFCLVWLDMISAIAAVAATEGKQAIQSSKLRRTIIKITIYSVGVISFGIAARTVASVEPWKSMTVSVVLSAIIVTELKSVFENLSKAGWNPLERKS